MTCECKGELEYFCTYGDGYYEPLEYIYKCVECGKMISIINGEIFD